jgi:hypothetical protein
MAVDSRIRAFVVVVARHMVVEMALASAAAFVEVELDSMVLALPTARLVWQVRSLHFGCNVPLPGSGIPGRWDEQVKRKRYFLALPQILVAVSLHLTYFPVFQTIEEQVLCQLLAALLRYTV